jgi:hypothetical protein
VRENNGVGYQLQIGTGNPSAGTPVVVTGTRVFNFLRTPVFGSLIVDGQKITIGLEVAFDFGSGQWLDPAESTVFIFLPQPTQPTFDTTFHGSSAGPHNVKGGLLIQNCPLTGGPETLGPEHKDPNAK